MVPAEWFPPASGRRRASPARRGGGVQPAAAIRRACAAALCLLSLIGVLGCASPALATPSQEAMFADNVHLLSDPAGTLRRLRLLGVERVRLFMSWQAVAPRADSRRRPAGFNASDPAAYPAANWAPYDTVIQQAAQDGIGVDLDLAGGAPLWATGAGVPAGGPFPQWSPSAREFGLFTQAAGRRYDGDYDPVAAGSHPGNPADLPAVRFWSIWNEPNYGPSLAPQGDPGDLRIEHSPAVYRSLLDAAYSALRATGHAGDTILWGELAPRGAGYWGVFSGMKPLVFLRALFCVDTSLRPLSGRAATLRGCAARPLSPRAFRAAHPGLFSATGVAVHPYMRWYAPSFVEADPDYASFSRLPGVERLLDRLQAVYGSHRTLPLFNTEFGYLTSPPKLRTRRNPWLDPATAAAYMNQAEYLSWRDPRLRSFMQYLLYDPVPPGPRSDYGGYASGLLGYDGRQKASYSAFRMPIWLPVTLQRRAGRLEVWGCVRPAHVAASDTGAPQSAELQFRPRGGGAFRTLRTLPITDSRGYIDVRVAVPASGTVRLAWTYPEDDTGLAPGFTVYSRQVAVTVSR